MLNKIVLGIAIAMIILIASSWATHAKTDENIVLNYIKEHPNSTAIKLVRNAEILADNNPNKMMPLASTVKLIIAIEYAEQAANNHINPDELISLNQLELYYVPNTDGGAHTRWLKSIKTKAENNLISIREIAKGMIRYSSNANTEWLCSRLGLNNINSRLEKLGIEYHSQIYYVVSSLFVGKEMFPGMSEKEQAESLENMTMPNYIKVTNQIHEKLIADNSYKNKLGNIGKQYQKIWSDKLPKSTVNEYVGILQKINDRSYFTSESQMYLDEVMEFLLENPANRKWLEHTGMKGGSTAFVLTKALYATDKKGNKTELAYFLNDLNNRENKKLRKSMNQFELMILTNEEFRNKVQSELQQ